MKKCMIFYEEDYGGYAKDLIEVAHQMYGNEFESFAVSIQNNSVNVPQLFDYSITINDQRIKEYDLKNITNSLEELNTYYKFDAILIPATHLGRMLAPRLAMRLKIGLVADVTKIKTNENGSVEMIRPAFDGKILAGIKITHEKPVMMSVRPGIFLNEEEKIKKMKVIEYCPKKIELQEIKCVEKLKKPKTQDIRKSNVIVAGGGGTLGNFKRLDQLSMILGGMTGASRRIVDANQANRAIQVGQSGKIVSPDLYIALGISGSLQHVAGIHRIKHLIAVNTNVNAPICSLADYVIEGDAIVFVEKLTKRIQSGNLDFNDKKI